MRIMPPKPALEILSFHRIIPENSSYFIPPMAISEKSFSKLVRRLMKQGRLVRLDEFIHDIKSGNFNKRKVALTFDDGYLDNYTIARNILKNFDAPATFFIPCAAIEESGVYWWDFLFNIVHDDQAVFHEWISTTDCFFKRFNEVNPNSSLGRYTREMVRVLNGVSESKRTTLLDAVKKQFGPYKGKRLLMNWDEIKQLSNDGFEIGSHTVSHIPLTDLSTSVAKREIEQSKYFLEEKIESTISGFCYPRGQFALGHASIAERVGYSYAVTTRFGSNHTFSDLFSLFRRNMSDYNDVRKHFAVRMHLFEISGYLDWLIATRRTG